MPRWFKSIGLSLLAGSLGAIFFVVVGLQQHTAGELFAAVKRRLVRAALTGVTLNNGNINVVTGNDVTSQTTALLPDTGAYRWTVNGSNYASAVIPFNSGSTQTDFSGNSNTGTTNGAAYVSGGQVGGAMFFDGVDDVVTIADSATLDLNGAFTISAWFNTNNAASFQYAFAKWFADHTAGGYIMGVNGNAAFIQKSNGSSWDTIFSPASTITSDTWHHVVATWDGTTNAGGYKLYINGGVVTSAAATQATMLTNNHPLSLGRYGFSNLNPWNGEIDEVQIYQRALNATEIAQLHADGNAGLGGPTIIQSEETIAGQIWNLTITPITSLGAVGGAIQSSNSIIIADASNGITGSFGTMREDLSLDATVTVPGGSQAGLQWKVNNTPFTALNIPFNSGGTQIDVGGNGINGTDTNGPVYTNTGCQVGGCMTFDGSNDYITLGASSAMSVSATSFTVMAWVNLDTVTKDGGIVSDYRETNGRWLLEFQQPSNFLFAMDTNGTWGPERAVGAVLPVVGTWYHVVGLYDHSTGALQMYVNGSLVSTENGSPVTIGAVNNPVIGSWYNLTTPYAFDGKIDEVQFYRRALTADEISIIYADGLANRAAPTSIHRFEHSYNQAWQLLAYEFVTSSGSSVGPVMIGSGTIAAAAATTLAPTTPSGTQSRNISISYTCTNADSAPRDLRVQYSVNGGSSYADASIVSTTSGTVSGSYIYGAACSGGTQTIVWNSVANLVASGVLDADVRIRLIGQINAAPTGDTANFSVQNPFIITTPTTINSGDTSYDGSEVLCSGTTLTINGTHSFAALDLLNACTMTHSTNTTVQTNVAVLTVTGNASIDATSTVNLNGKGFQGGQTRCQAGSGAGGGQSGTDPGSGSSFPSGGASYGGRGGTGNNSNVASSYGSMTAPADLGSGGAGGGDYLCDGGSSTGGAGGGYVKLVVNGTFTFNGSITANGNAGVTGVGPSGGGAGGSVWLDVGTIAGSGTIAANGGSASSSTGGSGGGGRVAVYYTNNTHTNLAGSITVYGGSITNAGSAGTIYLKPNGDNFGDLFMSNNNVASQYTTIISGMTQFDTVTISNAANVVYAPSTLDLDETLTIGGTASTRFALSGTAVTSGTGTASIVVNSGGILSHDFNTTARTNFIDISGIQTLTINSGGSVNVDGRGYRGGTTRCQAGAGTGGGISGTDPGSGSSFPSGGASYGGRGGTGNNSSVAASYGSPTQPTDLGSGGAGGGDYLCDGGTTTGGAGGGAVKIVGTGTATIDGTISANGSVGTSNVGAAGGGAGGSVWLDFGTIAGSGTVAANGANATASGGGAGGGGRVAIYYTTNTHASLTTSTTARGGSQTNAGGAGTIYFKPSSDNYGDLYFSNGGTAGQYTTLYPSAGATQFDTLTVLDAASVIYLPTTLEIDELLTVGGTASTTFAVSDTDVTSSSGVADIVINNNGILSHDTNTTTQVNDLQITGFRHATINSGGSMNVVGKGFRGGSRCTDGSGTGGGKAGPDPGSGASFPGGGGTYGGRGGNGQSTNYANFYGSITAPSLLGSGGAGGGDYGCDGGQSTGGAGGGYLKAVLTGTLTVNGSINASGAQGSTTSGQAGGGSGGSIWLDVGTIAGSGAITAEGGNPTSAGGGAGGGGRIAVYYNANTHSGLINAISVAGGTLSNYGSSGTAYIKQNSLSYGDVKVDNNNLVSAHFTNLFVTGQPSTYTVRDLYVIEQAKLLIDTPCSGTPAVTVTGSTYLTSGGTITNNQPVTCTVTQPPISITTTSVPNAIVGTAYSQTIASAGGYGPHTFTCRSGGAPVACGTVLPPGLSLSSAGAITGTPTSSGVYTFTVRATEASPGVGTDDQDLTISVGNAPTAPTVLFVHNTDAQLGNTTPSGIDASPVFSAIYNDPDLSDMALSYRIQVASDSGFTSLLWESGSTGTSLSAACAQGFRCANITYGGSTLSLTATTYYWRIKFFDSLNLEGAFSATNTFVTDTAPTAPTTLFSNDANAQSGLTNPIGIMAAHPVFSAIFNDPDTGDTAIKYRVQVDNNSDFSSPVWDNGVAGTNMASCTAGNRCADIAFGGADLEQNGAVYYWRIKFFDAAGQESAWSQDPISTNTFTMGQGGTSIQVQQQQAQQQQATVPDAPQAGAVEVLGPDSVRYNWIDMSNNEVGFRILNEQGNIIADVGPGVTQVTESTLSANAVVSGRSVLAYNAVGTSTASPFASVVTAAPALRPALDRRNGDSVTFSIEPAQPSFAGQTAVRFDLIVVNSLNQSRTLTSDWIQQGTYTFSGIGPNDSVQVRVTMRNQGGLQNEPGTYEEIGALSRRFAVTLGVFKKGTDMLPRPMAIGDTIAVRMALESIGADTANSVTINMPLPKYVLYRPGTMIIDGRAGADAPDNGSVGNQNGVSASWASVEPGERHTVSFELMFDTEALKALLAAANPIIPLQASVSFAESDAVYMSPAVVLEPDLATIQEPIEEPVVEPEPIVEDVPAVVPTPEETQIIEQILQQEFPSATPTPQPTESTEQSPSLVAPTLQTGETSTSSDGGSFNIGVTGDDKRLGLSGSASVREDVITFTGTTTEPFTVITLIFNDSVTAIVVSDAEGHWQTFVSAERLGIEPGQDAVVKIEAIAAKGDLRSERVSVGEVQVSRGRSGDITAEFETVVSESPALTVIKEVQKEVVRVIEKNEPVIQTTLAVSAPVVVASSVPLWGYLPYAPTMIYHLITYVIGYSGRKKRIAARFYGVAYDSITKQPLALAIIRIYRVEAALSGAASLGAAAASNKKLVTTVVTDKQGRYDALLQSGTYQLEVAKPGYLFPSQIVTTELDADYQHVYSQAEGITVQANQMTIPDVPLDPVNAQRQWQLATGIKKLWMLVQKVGNYLATPILIVGAVSSAAVVAAVPDKAINWVIAGLYIGLLAMQLKLKPKAQKAWGVVYDIASNAVLPLTALQLIEPASSKVVASRLSDYDGRFTFLPEPGRYVVKASKPGYQQVAEVVEAPQTDRQPLHGEVAVEKPGQTISGDIAMRQTN